MASKCVFIGFKRGTKGYVLLNIQSREILCLGMLYSMNMFFHIKGFKIITNEMNGLNIHDQIFLVKINLF